MKTNSPQTRKRRQAGTPTRASAREVFIVRLWSKPRARPIWLGQVQHVRTGQVVYVRGPKELLSYLQAQLDASPVGAEKEKGLK